MVRVSAWLWLGVAVVTLAYVLALLVKLILPALIVIAAVYGIYTLIFKRPW